MNMDFDSDSEDGEDPNDLEAQSDNESDQPIASNANIQKLKKQANDSKKGEKQRSKQDQARVKKKSRTKRTVYCGHCHLPGHRIDGQNCLQKDKAGCPCWRKRHGGCGDRSRKHSAPCKQCGQEPDDDPLDVHHRPETLENEVTRM